MNASEKMQKLRDVENLATRLLIQHGLTLWRFAYNRRKQTMGLCRYQQRRIELSGHFVLNNGMEEIVDTILHEIAHALAGKDHNHDDVWKQKCLEIGAKPNRCGRANMPQGRWTSSCSRCKAVFHKHRRPMRGGAYFCKTCGTQGEKLEWRLE